MIMTLISNTYTAPTMFHVLFEALLYIQVFIKSLQARFYPYTYFKDRKQVQRSE
jgi:hypothetical protein